MDDIFGTDVKGFGSQKKTNPALKGRAKIGDPRREYFSKRAGDGKLKVVKKRCPFCGHHKALVSEAPESVEVIIKCSRCKRRIKGKIKDG